MIVQVDRPHTCHYMFDVKCFYVQTCNADPPLRGILLLQCANQPKQWNEITAAILDASDENIALFCRNRIVEIRVVLSLPRTLLQ